MSVAQFAVEQAPDPIFRINAAGNMLDANEASCRMLGYARDQLLGGGVWDINPDWSRERWDGIWKSLNKQPLGHLIATMSHHDGSALEVDLHIRPLPLTKGTEAILYAREHIPKANDSGELERLRELLNVSESSYSFCCALRRVHAQSQRSQQPYCIARHLRCGVTY